MDHKLESELVQAINRCKNLTKQESLLKNRRDVKAIQKIMMNMKNSIASKDKELVKIKTHKKALKKKLEDILKKVDEV